MHRSRQGISPASQALARPRLSPAAPWFPGPLHTDRGSPCGTGTSGRGHRPDVTSAPWLLAQQEVRCLARSVSTSRGLCPPLPSNYSSGHRKHGAACAGSGVCPPSVSEKQLRWQRCAATAAASAALPRGTSPAPGLRHPELCQQQPSVRQGTWGCHRMGTPRSSRPPGIAPSKPWPIRMGC